jgi:hypothetical protein
MTGGMTSGVTYFGTAVGSRLPPGIAAHAGRNAAPRNRINEPPA